jgi:glycosyltransferase involved in cell wall biosynthesis
VAQSEPSLLVLIPAYNEADRIEPVLRVYADYFQRHYSGPFQLIVILNGCRDNTLAVVQKVALDFPAIQALDFPAPIGKGGALIEGLKLARRADLVGYVDADGATSPASFHDLVRRCSEADCVIGSRWIPGAILHQAQTSRRQFASRTFHFIVQVLFWMSIHDTQCGAKVMRRQAIETVHSSLRIADMAFDINLLYTLKRAGFKILEVPTEWTDKVGSKVVLGKTSLTMFLSVMRLRLIYSPLHPLLGWLRPVEKWIYRSLNQPAPLPRQPDASDPVKKV